MGLTLQLRTMKGGVVTKLCLIVFLPSILVLWDDKSTLAGSVPQTHDSSQVPKFLVHDKPGGKKSFIEIEGENIRKESAQKETAKGTCSDVTFGGCPIREEEIIDTDPYLRSARNCHRSCEMRRTCDYYRFNYQTKECTLISARYRSLCKIIAAPKEIQAFSCQSSTNPCDTINEEDCEYTGKDVKRYQ